MNKEQYIQMRRTGQYDFGLFYQYYLQERNNRDTIPFEIFVQAFRMYFQINGGAVVEFLDKKFEVQKIEDQQGNLLYIN